MKFNYKFLVGSVLSLLVLTSVGYGIAFGYGGGALSAPSDLTAVSSSFGRIVLNWQDNSTAEKGFKIERGYGPCSATKAVVFQQIAIVRANISSYTDTAFPSNATQYCYRVQAYNATGNSAYSNKASITMATLTSARSRITDFFRNLFQ